MVANMITRKGFLKKKHSCGFISQNCVISRPANKLYCAKKYQNRHFVLQAGIYIHLMRKNVLYKC